MQLPITREIAQLSEGNPWRAVPAVYRFVVRIVAEGRGNELMCNALREIRYAAAGSCKIAQAARLDRDNLSEMNKHLAPQLAAIGYRRVHQFTSNEEDKCVILDDRLICKTDRSLRFYDMQRSLLRSIEVDGFLSNFVCVGGRIYFFVDGSLYSLTADTEVRNEDLSLSSAESTVLDQGIAADTDGTLVVAEYKHDKSGESGALLYVLRAGGEGWATIDTLALRADKHCHIVVFDLASEKFYVTCGDDRKMLATLDLRGPQAELHIISSGPLKTGGYMCAAPWEGGLMCGTDYTGGTNFLVLVRENRIVRKEALRSPFRRSAITSIDVAGNHLLFAAWNMGHLPRCSNGILLKSPAGLRTLCFSEDTDVTFELFPSADGLVVRGASPDGQVFGIFRRSDGHRRATETTGMIGDA